MSKPSLEWIRRISKHYQGSCVSGWCSAVQHAGPRPSHILIGEASEATSITTQKLLSSLHQTPGVRPCNSYMVTGKSVQDHTFHHQLQASQLPTLLLQVALLACVCLASAQLDPTSTCSTLHPAIVARISKELAPWASDGISEALMRNASQLCPPSDRHFCRVKFIQVLIEDGQLYLTSIFPRASDHEGFSREAAGEIFLHLLLHVAQRVLLYLWFPAALWVQRV